MPGFTFRNPNPPYQTYVTMIVNDPNVPAGYVQTPEPDGAFLREQQQFMPGGASGGWPRYGDLLDLGTRQRTDPSGNRTFENG